MTSTPILRLTSGSCSAELIPFAAALRALWVPNREGRPTDVCLGYDDPAAYQTLDGCLGAVVGRYANRIAGARFSLRGQVFQLPPNEGENLLHSGPRGFQQRLWQVVRAEEHTVTFALDTPDGEDGFPGTLHTEVTYTLQDGALSMDYLASSDRDTVVNLTNHSYFNLAGQDGGVVGDHVLTVRAEQYTPTDSGNIPTGALAPVEGTPLDLRRGAALGDLLDDPFLTPTRGLDHNLVLSGGDGPAASLYCPRTGILLEMETTLEGVQVYTANFLGERPGKGGAVYGPHHGVCLETQHFPDAVNHANFPSPLLRAGETARFRTVYRFSAVYSQNT